MKKYITVEVKHWTQKPNFKEKLKWLKIIHKRLNTNSIAYLQSLNTKNHDISEKPQ